MKQENGENKVEVTGQSVWGTLKGLESFAQLIYSTKENGYAVSDFIFLKCAHNKFKYDGVNTRQIRK